MTSEKFTYLLANPEGIAPSDLIDLEVLLHRHPFFQSARALVLKALKKQNSYRYNDVLKVTAAHTSDRDILFQYITSEEFTQHEISFSIQQNRENVNAVDVVYQDVSSIIQDEKELERFEQEKQKAAAILNPNLFERKQAIQNEKPETSESTEKELTSRPLEFSQNDRYSFSEWLKLSKAQPVERTKNNSAEDPKPDESRIRQMELIEKFIKDKPRIIPEISAPSENFSRRLMQEEAPQESLMTETLAKVYLQQKNYKKAIQAYKILILKYPEKSGFFADQIRAIEKLINPEHS